MQRARLKTVGSECKFMEIDKLKYRHVRLIFPLFQTRRDYDQRLMDFNKTFPTENPLSHKMQIFIALFTSHKAHNESERHISAMRNKIEKSDK